MHDARATPAINGGEPLAASQSLPSAESSSVCAEPQAAEHALSVSVLVEQCRREIQAYRRSEASNEAYGLELLHRAIVRGDQDAWRGVQHCFDEIVRSWLHHHPKRQE